MSIYRCFHGKTPYAFKIKKGNNMSINYISNEILSIDDIVKQIRMQLLECHEHINNIDPLTEDEIRELVINENYFYVDKDGRILVSYCIKPLLENFKLYRIGGFTVLNVKNPSFITKREVVKLLAKLKQYILKHDISFITQIDLSSLESFYLGMGAKKVFFEDCLVQYPLFLKAYLDDSIKTKEAHKSKIFYIREASKL